MKQLISLALLALVIGCRPAAPDPIVTIPVSPVGTIPAPIAGSSVEPAILEADVEGVGKALIYERSIVIKLPEGYTRKTVKVTYKVTEGVQQIEPFSGTEIAFGDGFRPTVCIRRDTYRNCTKSYDLIIELPSQLVVTPDPDSRQLELANYYQGYNLTYRFDNFSNSPNLGRQFKLRLVSKNTGRVFVGDNYGVTDLAGNPIYVNQPTKTPFPTSGKLRLSGTLPPDLPAGDYTVTIQVFLCYGNSNGVCTGGTGYESVELPEPLVLKPGPPLVGEARLSPSPIRELTIRGRNFLVAKSVPVTLSNGFTPGFSAQATVENDWVARLTLPTTQPAGQYRLDILPDGDKPYRTQLIIPSASAPYWFNYVGLKDSFYKTQDFLPTLPTFKGGESLELLYGFVADEPISVQSARTVRAVRLINTNNPGLTYDLTPNGIFSPFSLYLDFKLWKWTLPTNLLKGEYALIFVDFDGKLSLPYYQKIRVD